MQRKRYAVWLWLLLGLFCLRVIGQLVVALFSVTFLPPMEEWYSGLVPYGRLLAAQVLIVLVFGKICIDFTRGEGFFAIARRGLGSALLTFGSLYLGVMVVRYVIRMSLYPQERWTGGSIPIFFHWILASFLLLVAHYHWTRSREAREHPSRSSDSTRWVLRAAWSGAGVLIGGGVLVWVAYLLAPWTLARELGISRPEFAVRIQRSVPMTTSDGAQLVSDIYRPRRVDPTPTILVRVPYSKTVVSKLFATVVGRMWAEHGYTVVIQGTRGRYESGGRHYPLRGERQDGIETLAWLAQQPWFDGRLGMWGGSYFGYTQWVLADQVDPGPSALFVQLASTDFHAMFYPGSAFSLESALFWAVRSRGDRDVEVPLETLERGYDGFPLLETDDRAVGDVPFFDDWVTHSERDQYWADIDGEDRARRLEAPMLLMAGWFDPFLPTQLADFERIRNDARPEVAAASRLIIGPWAHARTVTLPGHPTPRNYRLESLSPSVPWFDAHLRRSRIAGRESPRVRIYVMGVNVWRDEEEWPLARARYRPYYLQSNGSANTLGGDGELIAVPPASSARDTFVYDPQSPVPTAGGAMLGPRAGVTRQNELEARSDVLVYTTPPLTKDLEVTGPVKLVLFVSTTAPHTDFTGKLVDVHPDGAAYNVSDGILRRRYPEPSNAEGRNWPVTIEIDLWPTSIVFLKDHRIRLEVASSNYPRYDRNPNTGRAIATETHPIVATQSVYHGLDSPSRLMLPVVPR